MSLRSLFMRSPHFMVDSSVYGYRLYGTLVDALRAVTYSASDDSGVIYVMREGPTYQDSRTKVLFNYIKGRIVTLETDSISIDLEDGFEYNQELTNLLISLI